MSGEVIESPRRAGFWVVLFVVACVAVFGFGCGIGQAGKAERAASSTTLEVASSPGTTVARNPAAPFAPADAVAVETERGTVWISGATAYVDGCGSRGLNESTATAALAAAGHPPPGGFTSWGLACPSSDPAAPDTTLPPPTRPAVATTTGCHPDYGGCLPVVGDLDCPDVAGPVSASPADPYDLDANDDGIACN